MPVAERPRFQITSETRVASSAAPAPVGTGEQRRESGSNLDLTPQLSRIYYWLFSMRDSVTKAHFSSIIYA